MGASSAGCDRIAGMNQLGLVGRERRRKMLICIVLLIIFCVGYLMIMQKVDDYHPVPLGPVKAGK